MIDEEWDAQGGRVFVAAMAAAGVYTLGGRFFVWLVVRWLALSEEGAPPMGFIPDAVYDILGTAIASGLHGAAVAGTVMYAVVGTWDERAFEEMVYARRHSMRWAYGLVLCAVTALGVLGAAMARGWIGVLSWIVLAGHLGGYIPWVVWVERGIARRRALVISNGGRRGSGSAPPPG